MVIAKSAFAENLIHTFTKTLLQKTFESHLEGMGQMYVKLAWRASERLLGNLYDIFI